ncbi:hypothetical protein COV06_02790 [Candidatus Uhrbacteria bacterium CG10_big_fil_rev_8_21_14_0_10_50_16]|uniref:Outer membrane protein beta-barrel domain-containing protein n=1 Tax=Candidatus Uhrbacteria bacterium CG10_big_fil_rev_8_21_14_0_10_50_16 TaxID=1975039 RepID=A0A2H0RNK9_9BACT|nr:MAG: hypothetical protein COV06_02790 [Candidatus Uhrbacteria bacterium CG10_big_fil_rev_8_21_14_0_10_50_16]
MNRMLIVLLIGFLAAASPARAEDVLAPFQVLTAVHGESHAMDKAEHVSMRASGHLFWVPEDGTHALFGYVGPKFTFKEKYATVWFSPQVGVAGHWTPSGGTAALASFWFGINLLDDAIAIFLEGDGYFAEDVHDYYGYYEASFTPPWKLPLHVGFQVEQLNAGVTFGPQVTATVGPILIGLQYYVAPQEDTTSHILRGVFMVFL